MHLLPQLQALVLAERVYVDTASGRKVIAGTFDGFAAPAFPAPFVHPAHAYVSVTDLRGRITFTIKVIDNRDLGVIAASPSLVVEGGDPHTTLEFVMGLPAFQVPHPGTYSLELHANDEKIAARRITVAQLALPTG